MKNKDKLLYLIIFAIYLIVFFITPEGSKSYGLWSILPPVLMFSFIMLTQKVLEGFIWGGLLAIIMKYKTDALLTYNQRIIDQVTNPDNLWLMLVLLLVGALAAVLSESGLSQQFGEWAGKKAKNSKMALLINFITGCFLSFDPYLSVSTVGTCMAPVNNKFKIPKEKTALVTIAPAVTLSHLLPIGTGAIFITGLLVTNGFATKHEGFSAFINIMPFLFFPIAFLLVSFLTVIGVIPNIGRMKKVYEPIDRMQAAQESAVSLEVDTDKVNNLDTSTTKKKQPHLINFFIPIFIFISSTFYFGANTQLGAFLTILVSGVIFVAQGIFTPEKYVSTVLDGMKGMLELVTIMATAFVLANSVTEIGFTDYIVGTISVFVAPLLLPFIVFLVFSVTEFLVTLNWSLYIMAIPILLKVSDSIGANTPLTIAALISAGMWGATSCITSDIGLLTSYTIKFKVYDHFRTKLPYCLIAWVLSLIGYLVCGFLLK
ncbi:Na+/H+ antiporter NhaC family protein [Priestia aryabhattai]|uniref:Na+/H+ antiporter NhaC family protein n=1 Tax=Priestia aryabhattai TaxID=412384 RepID=UPI003982987A